MPDILLARGAMRHPGRRSINEHLFELARHEESKSCRPGRVRTRGSFGDHSSIERGDTTPSR